jgi:hypothetical protein
VPALPVLEYRTAPRATQPPRTAFSSIAAGWGVLMLVFGVIGAIATFADYDNFRHENERRWFANEVERRSYEIDRRNGVVTGTPPALYQGLVLHPSMHWTLPWFGLAIAVLGVPLIMIAVDARDGTKKISWRRWLPWLYLVPTLFLIAVGGEYQLESVRFFTFEVAFIGWLAVGTLALALWTHLDRTRAER